MYRLKAHAGFFKLMKEILYPYVLWPFDKKLISWLVTHFSTCCSTKQTPGENFYKMIRYQDNLKSASETISTHTFLSLFLL